MIIVLDASVVVDYLLNIRNATEDIATCLQGHDLCAPHLLDIEVTQVIRRFVLKQDITVLRGRDALIDLGDLPVTRYGHVELLPRIYDLRSRLTAYDATYLTLAEKLGAVLLTRDAAVSAAAESLGLKVESGQRRIA
jgi:predicted nucleic acid-binding protein